MDTKKRQAEEIISRLPADTMASLVEDMAEAVVAVLLIQAGIESGKDDNASGDLREV